MKKKSIILFCIVALIVAFLYLGPHFFSLTAYVQRSRLIKLWAYGVVAVLIVPSTICFQTIVKSRYLSPGILGMDALYVLIQSIIYYVGVSFFGDVTPNSLSGFFIQLGIMLIAFLSITAISGVRWESDMKESIWLMIGLVFGTVLRNLATFFQVLMDPNEYSKLQSRLFPSFQGIPTHLLWTATIIAIMTSAYLMKKRYVLDVYHLGKDMTQMLGIDVQKETFKFLIVVVIMVSTATALVGPLTFLGFMIANITYLVVSHHYSKRFVVGSLIGFIFIVCAQLLTERFFNYRYNLSLMIEGFGGLIFFLLLFRRERVKHAHY